jgi:hypothetical protein
MQTVLPAVGPPLLEAYRQVTHPLPPPPLPQVREYGPMPNGGKYENKKMEKMRTNEKAKGKIELKGVK